LAKEGGVLKKSRTRKNGGCLSGGATVVRSNGEHICAGRKAFSLKQNGRVAPGKKGFGGEGSAVSYPKKIVKGDGLTFHRVNRKRRSASREYKRTLVGGKKKIFKKEGKD